MIRSTFGTLIGVGAQQYVMGMTVGDGMRDVLSEVEPISNFESPCYFDAFTDLMWSGPLLTASKVYDEVRQTLELTNLVKLGGFSDWRLPTTMEVQSLLGRCPQFQETVGRGVWLKSPLEFVPKPMITTIEDNDELMSKPMPSSQPTNAIKRSKVVEIGALLVVRRSGA
jgi:hypothetical protein